MYVVQYVVAAAIYREMLVPAAIHIHMYIQSGCTCCRKTSGWRKGYHPLASQQASFACGVQSCFLQGVRIRVTPVWTLITPQASVALLEFPPQEQLDHAKVAAALISLKQAHAQVLDPSHPDPLQQ